MATLLFIHIYLQVSHLLLLLSTYLPLLKVRCVGMGSLSASARCRLLDKAPRYNLAQLRRHAGMPPLHKANLCRFFNPRYSGQQSPEQTLPFSVATPCIACPFCVLEAAWPPEKTLWGVPNSLGLSLDLPQALPDSLRPALVSQSLQCSQSAHAH